MISLVSYPRSGNTFLRNVLFDVYGIESKTYHNEAHGPDDGWDASPVVKTHLLPDQLPQELQTRPVVYLVRDGRDAIVSLAYHKRDLHAPDSLISDNITEIIYAAEGSYFSGWSKHVASWFPKAVLLIYFEDLVRNPIACCERLRPWLQLPAPNLNKLRGFNELKEGEPKYGSGKELGLNLSKIWFRSGVAAAWKLEMSEAQQQLFWHLHGDMSEAIGYGIDGGLVPCLSERGSTKKPFKLLLEANKLSEPHQDGIGRYVANILNQLALMDKRRVKVDVLIGDQVFPIEEVRWPVNTITNLRWFAALKQFLFKLLPAGSYNSLAKTYAYLRLKYSLKKPSLSNPSLTSDEYDAAWLPLPQHIDRLSKINYQKLWVTVHDLSHLKFPAYHTPANISLCNHAFDQFAKMRNVRFFSVSHSTKVELEQVGISSYLLYEAVDRSRFFKNTNQHLSNMVQQRYGLPNGKFLLCLFTLEPRKNLKRLIEAYTGLPAEIKSEYPLVIAGRKGWKWQEQGIEQFIDKDIRFTGYVQEEHITALYGLAYLFIYPSVYEGFGLPILEAQACGLPVLTSNSTSMPEVGGDAAMYFNPYDIHDMRVKLKLAIARNDYAAWRNQSIQNTWRFSWYAAVNASVEKMMLDNEA